MPITKIRAESGRELREPQQAGPVPQELRVRTIAIINQKGGCGKTTTAINLAGVFARNGLRTLLVDLDPQSHCAAGLAIPEQRIDVQIGDAMLAGPDKAIDWTRLLWRVSRNLDLAPSTVRLATIEAPRGGLAGQDRAEQRLSQVLVRLADQYDLCLIDCAPSIGLLTFNALLAATEILIPVETAFFALQGAGKQVNTIKSLAKKLDTAPPYRLLPTMHDAASTLANDVLDELRRRFGEKVTPAVIRLDPRLREAASFGQPIVEYAHDSPGAQDYGALGQWLIELGKQRPVRVQAEEADPAMVAPGPVSVLPGAGASLLGGRHPNQTIGSAFSPLGSANAAIEARTRAAEVQNLASRLIGKPARAEETHAATDASTTSATGTLQRSLSGILGVRHTSQGTLFVQPAALGAQISVAGDFNGWSADTHPMRLNPSLGVFERLIPLTPGRHQYRVVVDGRWIPDPYNPVESPNPFGGANSVVVVPEHSSR